MPRQMSMSEMLRAVRIDAVRLGDAADAFTKVVPFDALEAEAAAFVGKHGPSTLERMKEASKAVYVVDRRWGESMLAELTALGAAVFLVDDPRLAMARVLHMGFPDERMEPGEVHPTAIVHPDAQLDPTVSVGPGSVIGRCSLGEGTSIGRHCVIHDGSVIGRRVRLRDFCTIGGAGFGFARNERGALERIPHIGRAVVEDDVEIFPYSNVDRGTMKDTRVGRGTKLDHYVHIGHNCEIGEDVVVTARVVTSGSSRVGARTWLGVGAVLKESVSVGVEVTVGMGAIVLDDVPDGDTVVGVPARSIRRR